MSTNLVSRLRAELKQVVEARATRIWNQSLEIERLRERLRARTDLPHGDTYGPSKVLREEDL